MWPTSRADPAAWRGGSFVVVAAAALLASACREDMHDSDRYDPFEASPFFADGRASRDPVEGTVARGQLREDEHLYLGRSGADLVDSLPFPATAGLLLRGRQRYEIFCSPCHARTGEGDGMIVRRGFRKPPSMHEPRLREARLGHFYDVLTNGFGAMPAYAAQIPVRDRWAIVAYLRALQLSRAGTLADVPEPERAKLDQGGAP